MPHCHHPSRRGAALVLLVLLLPAILAVAAYTINVVYMETTRTELQITTDVATRAAGRVLAVTGDKKQAAAAAERLLSANPFLNQKLAISGTDIVYGVSTRNSSTERYQFATGDQPNAVQLKSLGSEQVPMLFPTVGVPIDFRPIKMAISTQVELDIALVLDRSGSMAYASDEASGSGNPPASAPAGWGANDPVPPNARWLDTVAAIQSFLDIMNTSVHDERVTLNTYSSKSKTDVKLTGDYASVTDAMRVHSNRFEGGATNIGGGILEGAAALSDKKLARPWASRVMIVLSDGIHNTGTDPILAAHQAASENVMIYTVTFSNEADQTQMKKVAETGSGLHFHAQDSAQLTEAFREIARSLPTLITF